MTGEEISLFFRDLQKRICDRLEEADGKGSFSSDYWQHKEGGGGLTRVIQDGDHLEKGGVNFSAVSGKLNPSIRKALGVEAEGFFATGVSIVLHPQSPLVPIIHMNVRYFELENGQYWFGGGIDLTPIYVVKDDAKSFHSELKKTCDRHSADYYPEFKKWADDYFYIPHRAETRGVGGIFFDKLAGSSEQEKLKLFDFVKDVGETFLKAYLPIFNRNKHLPWTDKQKEWQLIRRGRYVEFNLVYDRGTKFGLETGGRVESILMSLPALVSWKYDHKPSPDSEENTTLEQLRRSIDWIS